MTSSLTTDEQRLILRATAGNTRDHTIISLALGTGLRLAEIVGLDGGDVFALDGTPRVRVRVRADIAKGSRAADVFLPDRLVAKLKRFWRWKRTRGENLGPDAALFANQSRVRISKRRVQFASATWQRRAGFDWVYGFHALRHTAVTNVYRASKDLFLTQRFARHLSPLATTRWDRGFAAFPANGHHASKCEVNRDTRSTHRSFWALAQLAHTCSHTRLAIDLTVPMENASPPDLLARSVALGAAVASLAPGAGRRRLVYDHRRTTVTLMQPCCA